MFYVDITWYFATTFFFGVCTWTKTSIEEPFERGDWYILVHDLTTCDPTLESCCGQNLAPVGRWFLPFLSTYPMHFLFQGAPCMECLCIFTNIGLQNDPNIGKYTYKEPMGYESFYWFILLLPTKRGFQSPGLVGAPVGQTYMDLQQLAIETFQRRGSELGLRQKLGKFHEHSSITLWWFKITMENRHVQWIL